MCLRDRVVVDDLRLDETACHQQGSPIAREVLMFRDCRGICEAFENGNRTKTSWSRSARRKSIRPTSHPEHRLEAVRRVRARSRHSAMPRQLGDDRERAARRIRGENYPVILVIGPRLADEDADPEEVLRLLSVLNRSIFGKVLAWIVVAVAAAP